MMWWSPTVKRVNSHLFPSCWEEAAAVERKDAHLESWRCCLRPKKGVKVQVLCLGLGFFCWNDMSADTHSEKQVLRLNTCVFAQMISLQPFNTQKQMLGFFVHHSEIAYLGSCFYVRSRAGFSQPLLCCFFLFEALIFKSMEPRNGKVITGASCSLQMRARVLFLHREVLIQC